MSKPVVLIVLDGWGLAPPGPANAVAQAKTPNMNSLWVAFPHCQLQAAGEAVGLPRGESGNSEVGHLNLGAGRVVYQDLSRINLAIADGSFFESKALLKAVQHVKRNHSTLHLMGLVSPGGVHSTLEHIYALLRFVKDQNVPQVFVHVFTDGRDTPPTASPIYIRELEERAKEIGVGKIASVCGRYYSMDRDHRWRRTQKAYEALTAGKALKAFSALEAVEKSYRQNRTDEFILPTVIVNPNGSPLKLISQNDGVIFFNFREDRARQLTRAFVMDDFEKKATHFLDFDPYVEKYHRLEEKKVWEKPFPRGPKIKNLYFVTLIEYEPGLACEVAFSSKKVELPLARILSQHQLSQLHISETEKFPHVTYFFNGGRGKPFPGEEWLMIPSPKVATYDLKPEMSALGVTDALLRKLQARAHDFIIVNFANPDMVGHTGVLKAGIVAVETVDNCLGKVVKQVLALGGVCVVVADHGNVEIMKTPTGEVDTEHSTSPVPCILISEKLREGRELPLGILADVAPTILGLMKIPRPSAMTGRDLLSL